MSQNTKQPHKHAEVIIAWANGAKIQFLEITGEWRDTINPHWGEIMEYRIKPAEPERTYPMTQMTGAELEEAFNNAPGISARSAHVVAANSALRHACDKGQIVPREEFDAMDGARKEAEELLRYTREKLEAANKRNEARDMAVAKAVDAWYAKTFENKQRNSDNYLAAIIAEVRL